VSDSYGFWKNYVFHHMELDIISINGMDTTDWNTDGWISSKKNFNKEKTKVYWSFII